MSEREHSAYLEEDSRVKSVHQDEQLPGKDKRDVTEEKPEEVNQEAGKPIANPAYDGTSHVEEPSNDWPAADQT